LALDLPDRDDSSYTVFVRIDQATMQPASHWLLRCKFVSPLTVERLRALLQASPKQSQPEQNERNSLCIARGSVPASRGSDVAGAYGPEKLPDRGALFRSVYRPRMIGDRPMPAARGLRVFVGYRRRNCGDVEWRVDVCLQKGQRWCYDCFIGKLPVDIRKYEVAGRLAS
jgi:hypothetical protein